MTVLVCHTFSLLYNYITYPSNAGISNVLLATALKDSICA